MKYLKLFNEAKSGVDVIKELTSLCHDYLPSLFDDGYRIEVKDCRSRFSNTTPCAAYSISIKTPISENFSETISAKWEDIKDYIIPFVTLLEEDYTFYKMTTTLKNKFQVYKKNQDYIFIRYVRPYGDFSKSTDYLNKEDILEDKLNDKSNITTIILNVNPKKK